MTAKQLFGLPDDAGLHLLPASALESNKSQQQVVQAVSRGEPVLVFFQEKLGGEISIPATSRSPEIAFDITLAEILKEGSRHKVGRFGIVELQTMDVHGTYRNAVKNAKDALRLHGRRFYQTLRANPLWLSERIEGPNKANVFKRTFYQLVFKFRLGSAPHCAGCMLGIPTAVWDSWMPHLGMPRLAATGQESYALAAPGEVFGRRGLAETAARIYVFEPDADSRQSPNPLTVRKIITTSADALIHHALRMAPEAVVGRGGLVDNLPERISARLRQWWPGFAP
jgi:hypothetical protein